MANKKFDIKKAISAAVPAMAGGVAVGYLNKMLVDKVPDPKMAAAIPVVLGAFLAATQVGPMGSAGLGMIGAASSNLLTVLGIPGMTGLDIAAPGFTMDDVDDFEAALVSGPGYDEEAYFEEVEGEFYDDDDDYNQ
jgi:hypothetical protein